VRENSATVAKSAGRLVRGIPIALAILAFWTALSLFAAYYALRLGIQPTWRESLLSSAADYWTAALLCVPLAFLTRRFLSRPWREQIALQALGLLIFLVLHPAVSVTLIDIAPDSRPPFIAFLREGILPNLIQYVGIVGYVFALCYGKEVESRRMQEAALRQEWAQTRLQLLRTQMRPEFLFSSLRCVSRLMETDVEAARTAMARLSELLRMSLECAANPSASVREALEEFECYLDLERTRLGEKFEFAVHAEHEILEAAVPRTLLRSAVEAGLGEFDAPLAEPGFVNIRAERATSGLLMTVDVGGPAFSETGSARQAATGAAARLEEILPADHVLQCLRLPDQTLRIQMEMPLETLG